jgi:hypothetical protein
MCSNMARLHEAYLSKIEHTCPHGILTGTHRRVNSNQIQTQSGGNRIVKDKKRLEGIPTGIEEENCLGSMQISTLLVCCKSTRYISTPCYYRFHWHSELQSIILNIAEQGFLPQKPDATQLPPNIRSCIWIFLS